jgi:hypothetical protein
MVKIVNYVVSDVAFVTINKIGNNRNHIENNDHKSVGNNRLILGYKFSGFTFLEHHHFDSKSKLCDLNFNLIVHVVAVKSDVLLSENRL